MTQAVVRILTAWCPAPSPDPTAAPCLGLNIQMLALSDEEILGIGRPASPTGRAARALLITARNRRAAACRACGACVLSRSAFTLPRPD